MKQNNENTLVEIYFWPLIAALTVVVIAVLIF